MDRQLPSVPGALTERELLALGDAIATAMPALPPRLLLPARYAAGLAWDAARWRALPSQLHDSITTEQRRRTVASSHAIAHAVDWHRVAARPSHTTLQSRRTHHATPAHTPAQIHAHAVASWAAAEEHTAGKDAA